MEIDINRLVKEYGNMISMIAHRMIQNKEIAREAAQKAENVQEQKTESEKTENVQEQKAIHPKYGTGIVTSEDDMMVEVEFPNYGKKQFIKAFQEVEMIR